MKGRPRARSPSDSEAETGDEDGKLSVAEVLELRKLRKGKLQHGVEASRLGLGDPRIAREREEEEKRKLKEAESDPWKLQSGGGLVDMAEVKAVTGAGFAAASNSMDTEKKMNEFIEEELRRKRLIHVGDGENSAANREDANKEEDDSLSRDLLETAAAAAKPQQEGHVSFSAAMLTSIPVVDLGINSKLKNIEATEKAKQELVDRKANRTKETDKDKLVGSMNVTAADRFLRGKPQGHRRGTTSVTGGGNGSQPGEQKEHKRKGTMATDDLVMKKFKERHYPRRR